MPAKKNVGYANYRLKPLQIITAEAKKIQAANKNIKWPDAIKKASAKYRSGSIADVPAKKAAPVKKAAKKKASSKPIQAKLFGAKKPAGIQTKSRSHTDYNKPTVNIQIGNKSAMAIEHFCYGVRDGIEQVIKQILADIDRAKNSFKVAKHPSEKAIFKKQILAYKKELIYYKGQLSKQNQHIKSLLK